MTSHILDTISHVGTADFEGERMEVCCETKSTYDALKQELAVSLDSFLRHSDPALHSQRINAYWLPKKEIIHERVSFHEAGEMARDIAASWHKRISRSIPPSQHSRTLNN